jgi:D-3-phosphoglycerate dehydrogenase / 2-oxoglutarate reductase
MKVLISSRSFGNVDSEAIKLLKDAGLEPVLNPYGRVLDEDELIALSKDTVGIIAGTEKITREVIEHAKSLKVISRYGIGLDNIDLGATKERKIIVCNTPDVPVQAVAELTITLILNLLRRVCKMDREIRSNVWKARMGNLLEEKKIGIIGLGRIGKRLAVLIEPFNVDILAYETKPDNKFIKRHNIKLVPLEELMSESDIISLHVPLTDETRNIIGKKELSIMKKNVLIINTARGGLIDENALIDALEIKSIGGVAIDAFEVEPYKGRLLEFNNVILTPHIGSYTTETRKKMEIETVENMINALREVNII